MHLNGRPRIRRVILRHGITIDFTVWSFVFGTVLSGLAASGQQSKAPAPATYSIPKPPKPDFSHLDWLIGEWKGTISGQGAVGTIIFSATYDLEKRFIVLREALSLPATKTAPATHESWMGVLSAGDPGFVLNTFSSTGFMTRYRLVVSGSQIYFNPEGGDQPPPGWLFRRMLERIGPAAMDETVQVSPMNKPFFVYYTAKLTRAAPAKQPPAK